MGEKEFGKRMRARRVQLKLSQERLGCAMGLTQSLISQYETGKRHPLPEMMMKLTTHLNTTADYLIGRSSDPNQLSSYERDVLDWLRSLPDKPAVEDIQLALFRAKNLSQKPILRRRRK